MKLLDWELKELEKYPKLSKQQAYQRLENGKEVLCLVEPRSIYLISEVSDLSNTINLMNLGVYKATFYKYLKEKINIDGVKEIETGKLYELSITDLKDYIGLEPVIVEIGGQYFEVENDQDLRKVLPYETADRKLKFYIK